MTSSLTDLGGLPVVEVGDHPDTAAAEHWLASLDPQPVLACTHLVRDPRPHVTWTLVFDGDIPAGLPPATPGAARDGGRAVVYPGVGRLTGEITVGDVLAGSAIDRVEILGGGEAEPSAVLRTNEYVRPQWRDGMLVLMTMPAVGGVLVPFETRNPTPCCAAH
ncbi:hypothetical protein COUCH_31615 [Couchioplanes caeruleus]|uniref:hypothetical protein n=1 Tax=Couchioplanes caeruleus TaxID=56438 RepID=UPI0020BDF08E|nr:hypothetical protein [Couchioplanes caeruleus]UQU63518.1 hypothetical protein COUCH_31615 [Couchioplanes caeruleus]